MISPNWKWLLANWKDRWADKPFFAEQLAGGLPLAVVKLERQKNLENYRVGDVVASLKGLGGKLTEVKLARGRLPQGLQLDQTTFQLVVSNLTPTSRPEFKQNLHETRASSNADV